MIDKIDKLTNFSSPVTKIVQDGPLIYSLFLIIIGLLIAALIGLYIFMRNERAFWKETAKDLQSEIISLLNDSDVE